MLEKRVRKQVWYRRLLYMKIVCTRSIVVASVADHVARDSHVVLMTLTHSWPIMAQLRMSRPVFGCSWGFFFAPWAPNASAHLLPEAGAT